MADNYNIHVDLSGLFSAHASLAQQIFPLVAQAVRSVAEEGAYRWKDAVWKAKLWQDGEKTPYVESIKWEMTGPFSAEIWTDFALAQEIETGRPAKDMKVALQTSNKTRVTGPKAKHPNQRYLIIPFRHNTSGNDALASPMPMDIYGAAKKLSASTVLPPGSIKPATRLSGNGSVVAQASYNWGGRLPAGMAPKLSPKHHSDPFAGMVKMQTSAGGSKSSAYLTFRTMGEWSSGWVKKAQPGLFLAKGVSDSLQGVLEDAVGQAVTLKSLKVG